MTATLMETITYTPFEKARIKFRKEFLNGIKPVDSRQPIPDDLAQEMVNELMELEDEWTVVTRDGSLCAHFEHTIAITDDGTEILTLI